MNQKPLTEALGKRDEAAKYRDAATDMTVP